VPSMTEIKSCYLSKLQRLLRLRMPRVGSREDLKRLKYIRLSSYQIAFFSISFYDLWKYWCQRADEGLGTLSLRCIQEPLVVRNRDGRHPRGPPGGALLLCVCSTVGVSRSMESDSLSVVSVYPR